MATMDSKWWAKHPQMLENGLLTNAYFECKARGYFEKYCAEIGVEPYVDVEYESAADLPRHAVGLANRNRVRVNFNYLRKKPHHIGEVVAHEMAHVWAARNTCEKRSHGPRWREKLVGWGFKARLNLKD